MPVTKHKAASCRKFNVVAPRGGDKRGESFSQLSTVANFVDSRVKAVYGTAKEKSKSTRLVLGKVQLVRFTLKQRGELRNRLNPRKVRFLFFPSFLLPFHSLCTRMHPPIAVSQESHPPVLCFVFSRFVSLQPRIQWRIFTSVSNYPRTKGRSREEKNTISKVFFEI